MQTPPRKILIIPHQPHRNIKVRAIEMARYLAGLGRYEVYMLTWRLSQVAASTALLPKVLRKSMEAWQTFRTPFSIQTEENIHWVSLPYLLAPTPWCQAFNQRQVTQFVRRKNIQIILSGNAYHFPMPELPGVCRVYDVVDDHLSPESGPHWRKTRAFSLRELQKSDQILTISHALQEVLRKTGFSDTVRVPNGVDLAAFRQTLPEAALAVRARYHLENCWTVGYIGNHGWWAGMELLLGAFAETREKLPHGRLLIVGPGEDLAADQRRWAHDPRIIFTGPVPPSEITAYFQAIDIGVLPFQICPFTDNALPLKILEYGAARKPVLSTPLKELKTLAFPHVSFVKADVSSWTEALLRESAEPTPWQADWDAVIADYDWQRILQALPPVLEADDAPVV